TGAAPVPPPPPPPPHATKASASPSHSVHQAARRRRPRRARTPNEKNENAPRPASCTSGPPRFAARSPDVELALVRIVSVEATACVPSGVTDEGEKTQLAAAGRLPQLKLTAWVKPLSGVTVKVIAPV